MYGNNVKKGTYRVKNTEKYLGSKRDIVYRSHYEEVFFQFADNSPQVIKWVSEGVVVPYYDPVKEKQRRYIVDIYMEVVNSNGELKKYLIEIKPFQFTQPPRKGKKRKDLYENECATFITNQAKWQYAKKYADERGWEFQVITENQLFKG